MEDYRGRARHVRFGRFRCRESGFRHRRQQIPAHCSDFFRSHNRVRSSGSDASAIRRREMEMSTLTIDEPKVKPVASAAKLNVRLYGDLLKRFAPKVIETPGENRAALRIMERLMLIGDGERTAEQSALLKLLGALIEQYEKKAHPAATAEPRE